jgi:hypothetical protein
MVETSDNGIVNDSPKDELRPDRVRNNQNLTSRITGINQALSSDKTVTQKKKAIKEHLEPNPGAGRAASAVVLIIVIWALLVILGMLLLLLLINSVIGGVSNSAGCYIATMAYGDHDAPAVLTLRSFRDNYLQKKAFGRKFIAWYYQKSPGFVEKYGAKLWLHRICRSYLNVLVVFLRLFFKVR